MARHTKPSGGPGHTLIVRIDDLTGLQPPVKRLGVAPGEPVAFGQQPRSQLALYATLLVTTLIQGCNTRSHPYAVSMRTPPQSLTSAIWLVQLEPSATCASVGFAFDVSNVKPLTPVM